MNLQLLETILIETFAKGLNYYRAWTIILLGLLEIQNVSLSEKITAILLALEVNDFYGLKTLETAIKRYWRSNENIL